MKEINFKIEIKSYLNNFGKNYAHKALLPNALRKMSIKKTKICVNYGKFSKKNKGNSIHKHNR